jgi:peptide deformylase
MNKVKLKSQLEIADWIRENTDMRFFGDLELRTVNDEVRSSEFKSEEIEEYSIKLIETLKKVRENCKIGVGLAANQIGIKKRMFVIMLTKGEFTVICNPKIISLSDELGSYYECCLSSGALLSGEVIRPLNGVFNYQDIEGNQCDLSGNESQTRGMLHEIDHLDGILCTDKYSPGTLKFVEGNEELYSYKIHKL